MILSLVLRLLTATCLLANAERPLYPQGALPLRVTRPDNSHNPITPWLSTFSPARRKALSRVHPSMHVPGDTVGAGGSGSPAGSHIACRSSRTALPMRRTLATAFSGPMPGSSGYEDSSSTQASSLVPVARTTACKEVQAWHERSAQGREASSSKRGSSSSSGKRHSGSSSSGHVPSARHKGSSSGSSVEPEQWWTLPTAIATELAARQHPLQGPVAESTEIGALQSAAAVGTFQPTVHTPAVGNLVAEPPAAPPQSQLQAQPVQEVVDGAGTGGETWQAAAGQDAQAQGDNGTGPAAAVKPATADQDTQRPSGGSPTAQQQSTKIKVQQEVRKGKGFLLSVWKWCCAPIAYLKHEWEDIFPVSNCGMQRSSLCCSCFQPKQTIYTTCR